jgi:hypothetical protein
MTVFNCKGKGMVSTITDQQQRTAQRACNLWVVLLALASSLSVAQDNSEQVTPVTAPWYQVEVVIFTQQGYAGEEQPPRRYSLDFPKNTLELLDPNQVADNDFPVAGNRMVSSSDERIIPRATVSDPALGFSKGVFSPESAPTLEQQSPFDDYDLAQINAQDAAFLASDLIDSPTHVAAEAYVAEYEPTFVKLPRDVRNLNESSQALDRQAQYNVVFHEAWRFSADELEQDPWVIIKAGKQYLDRFEIEGSLRFYKSRFLHFQSDLWLLEFDPQGNTAKMIELPEFPIREQPSLSDSYVIAETQFDQERIEDLFIDAPANEFAETLNDDAREMQQTVEDVQQARQYPLKSLWTFDQSTRLEEQQSYYIDHPKMGVMLTIIPYEPAVLNPPLEETMTEAE